MELSGQYIRKETECIQYSGIVKKEIIYRMIAMHTMGMNSLQYFGERKIFELIEEKFTDTQIVKDFNKKMNFTIKLHSPGNFIVNWNKKIQMGDNEILKGKKNQIK